MPSDIPTGSAPTTIRAETPVTQIQEEVDVKITGRAIREHAIVLQHLSTSAGQDGVYYDLTFGTTSDDRGFSSYSFQTRDPEAIKAFKVGDTFTLTLTHKP